MSENANNESSNGNAGEVPCNLPLRGVRVVDLSWIVAGPQATRILGDFGADIIRVEYAGRLDSSRKGQAPPDIEPGSPNGAPMFNNFNRNKRSVTLNMNLPEGLAAIKQLIAVADVVVENFSAGVMDAKGLSYKEMSAVNPRIIYVSISGFGHTGRNRDYVTWGPTAQALSGLTFMSGLPNHPPAGWGFSYLDHGAGFYGALAVLMALHHRNRTGRGQHIDISQIETGMVLTGTAILDKSVNGRSYRRPGNPPGNRSSYPAVAPHNTYPCRGVDRWIAIVCENERQWSALVEAMESPAWASRPEFASNAARVENQDVLDGHIGAWTSAFDPFDLMLLLQARGVPAGGVQTMGDRVERDPQLESRRFYRTASHPELGVHRFEGVPLHMTRSDWRIARGAPLLGEHNAQALCELLGMSDEEMFELTFEAGII